MTRLLPRVGADPGRLVRHGRIGDRPGPARHRQPRVAGRSRPCRTGCRCWLTCRHGATGPDAARAILDAARPEGCGLRAARDDAQAAISRLRSAAQIAPAHGGIGLLRRCQRDREGQGIQCFAPGVLPAA